MRVNAILIDLGRELAPLLIFGAGPS